MKRAPRLFSRSDTSVLGTWWWTIDRSILFALIFLAFIGLLFLMSSSPAVAERLGYSPYFFVKKQIIFLGASGAFGLLLSMLPPSGVRKASIAMFALAFIGLLLVPFIGTEIKGARRWLYVFGFSVQPSEFMKPAFAVIAAYLLALQRKTKDKRLFYILGGLFFAVALLIVTQPDIGMMFTLCFVFFAQIFIAGLPWLWFAGLSLVGVLMPVLFYFIFPHFRIRINAFLQPDAAESFQVNKGLEAYTSGGIFGKGIGEGTIKKLIPDAHTDFIMPVAAEEYGLFFCLIVLSLFAFIIVKGFLRLMQTKNTFIILATSALLIQFFLQMFINIASNLRMIPPKGMTLPFVSYGGSSLLAISFAMGVVLALTRKNTEDEQF